MLLATFLKNVFSLVSALPGALRFDALEGFVLKAKLLDMPLAAPFLGPLHADGTLEIRMPKHHDAKCESLSELTRLATAAVLTYHHYTNFCANVKSSPADDACLLFLSMALNSCQDAECSAGLSQTLQAMGNPITFAELRWLLFYLRAQLWGLFARVHGVMKDVEGQSRMLLQQQSDFLALVKVSPEHPAGYLYYARACLRFQQLRVAEVFATKGAVVAARHSAAYYQAALGAVRCVALALGANGDTASVAQLQALVADVGQVERERAVLPSVYHALLAIEPEWDILQGKVLPAMSVAGDATEMPVLDMLYSTPPPDSIPRGAVPALAAVNHPSDAPPSEEGAASP